MERVLRWLFNIVSLFSFLLCVAVGVMWVRSYWVGDYWLWYDQEGYTCGISAGNGRVRGGWADYRHYTGANLAAGHYQRKPEFTSSNLKIGKTHFSFGGVNFNRTDGEFMAVQVHLFLPFVLSALLPALWVVRWRGCDRAAQGMCPVCGYDMRASPGRCPECGTLSGPDKLRRDVPLSAVIGEIIARRKA